MSMVELQPHFKDRPVIVVMGSSGCGKSTIAKALSTHLALPYIEADDLHPACNVEKMSNGIALKDADRWPWFELVGKAIKDNFNRKSGSLTACSALKRSYRDYLSKVIGAPTLFVYLDVNREDLLQRMQNRDEHYMPPSLLDSQLAILEPPEADEFSIRVEGDLSVDEILKTIVSQLEKIST